LWSTITRYEAAHGHVPHAQWANSAGFSTYRYSSGIAIPNHLRRWIVGLVAVMVVLGLVIRLGTHGEAGGGSLPGGGYYFYSRTALNARASAAAWVLPSAVIISVVAAIQWALFRYRGQLRQHRWVVGLVALVFVLGLLTVPV
jgi:hypothetical protein